MSSTQINELPIVSELSTEPQQLTTVKKKFYYRNAEYQREYYNNNKEKFLKKIYIARRHAPISYAEEALYKTENILQIARLKKNILKFRLLYPDDHEEKFKALLQSLDDDE